MSINGYTIKNNFTINLKKIEQIILYIQKRIYNASKKCEINNVHKTQLNLIKNLDYQIVFVQLVVQQITKNVFLANYCYWKIFLYLYICINIKKTPYTIVEFVKDKVEQYKIFALLQPEWEPRCEHLLYIKKKDIYSNKLKVRIKYFFADFTKVSKKLNKVHINIDTNMKVVNSQHLVNKINSTKFISSKLHLWLNSQNLVDHNYNCLIEQEICYCFDKNKLYELLRTILHIGIEWHIYTNLKIKKIYKNIILVSRNNILFIKHLNLSKLNLCIAFFVNTINIDVSYIEYKNEKIFDQIVSFADFNILIKAHNKFSLKLNNSTIKLLFNQIRYILYRKNKIGQWRSKTHLTLKDAKAAIRQTLLNWYKFYFHTLDDIQMSTIDLITEKLFYTWQIKK